MKMVTLGKTGITVPQNAFGALPVQRISKEEAVYLLRKAYEGGMRYFDQTFGALVTLVVSKPNSIVSVQRNLYVVVYYDTQQRD